MAIAGKFPGADYADERCSAPPDGLQSNLGRMPVATIGDESVGQSGAINFLIASECGLMGSSTMDAAKILSICEHLKEMITAFYKIAPWGTDLTPENADNWFDGGADDTTGPADGSKRDTRFLKWWSGRIEQCLGGNGFAVGNSLSLADVMIYYIFAEELKAEECNEDLPQFRREPFGNKARTLATLASCPKILASINAVSANENFQKWLSVRGVQMF
eukprot:CAMPEP_0116873760 /NCGR_PEP_ID=MMETSP0463-20121206/5044_1 /TAXON_ID=181622 /ORGANISM="Strombidinopsis sp, Strain SopsisLIS2011" /LENGTH=217 /DNA_ID=CAMNT_0004516371 /DNA_START=27 /DNA_END=680 /DNA_ORIENTATION=+